ncbi:Ribosomal protein L19 [Candidatus Omnitrophus magneticus]|uniref:Large ribosomal subunit protein bL19 n=1 Tax=Candidatus Omnitrophus magneticus TaxID=1609969 RepID=A0A0F0CML1_9BACT|nr:Ribosomal protein L19 [Candidatus Omnitrophus magneticus]
MKKEIKTFEEKYMRKEKFEFEVGDAIDVFFRITEGDKTRAQLFSGLVIGIKGTGISKAFTVRRISYGEGVERVFPYNSPLIEKVVVTKKGRVRRAKLYYLRGRTGKRAVKVKEQIGQEA